MMRKLAGSVILLLFVKLTDAAECEALLLLLLIVGKFWSLRENLLSEILFVSTWYRTGSSKISSGFKHGLASTPETVVGDDDKQVKLMSSMNFWL